MIGSDEEIALQKAFKNCFPLSQQVRNLEQKVILFVRLHQNYLENGFQKVRNTIPTTLSGC